MRSTFDSRVGGAPGITAVGLGGNRPLGRWVVSAASDGSGRRATFYIRTLNRCIGLYEDTIGYNQIDGWLYEMRWIGDPTDEEKAEIILAV